jgi:hypothetical protein
VFTRLSETLLYFTLLYFTLRCCRRLNPCRQTAHLFTYWVVLIHLLSLFRNASINSDTSGCWLQWICRTVILTFVNAQSVAGSNGRRWRCAEKSLWRPLTAAPSRCDEVFLQFIFPCEMLPLVKVSQGFPVVTWPHQNLHSVKWSALAVLFTGCAWTSPLTLQCCVRCPRIIRYVYATE